MFKQLQGMIDRLNESNSNNDKIESLKHYDDMRDLLFYTYSPFKKYYVTSKVIIKRGKTQETTTQFEDAKEEDLFGILDRLDKRELSGHEALDTINDFTSKFKEYEDLIHMIIDGNLKIRMSASSINKVFPGLIPKFDVALAKAYEPRLVSFDLFNWYASRKLDGCLDGETMVEFENGETFSIKDVVENRISGKIKSFNEKTKEVEYKEILDWMKNLEDINDSKTEWFEVELENGEHIKLTGNHRVWIPEISAYRRVDELNGDEEFLLD